MKSQTTLIILLLLTSLAVKAQLYSTSTSNVKFFSTTPVEDIAAESKNLVAILNTKTNEVAFQVSNTSFDFPNKLMQEHFNEKYMESEKYPKSMFGGTIKETINYTKNGTYDITVVGTLAVHGVLQERTISGKLVIANGSIQLQSKFAVKVADHKIEIPKLVTAKIAEEINVTVDVVLQPKK